MLNRLQFVGSKRFGTKGILLFIYKQWELFHLLCLIMQVLGRIYIPFHGEQRLSLF